MSSELRPPRRLLGDGANGGGVVGIKLTQRQGAADSRGGDGGGERVRRQSEVQLRCNEADAAPMQSVGQPGSNRLGRFLRRFIPTRNDVTGTERMHTHRQELYPTHRSLLGRVGKLRRRGCDTQRNGDGSCMPDTQERSAVVESRLAEKADAVSRGEPLSPELPRHRSSCTQQVRVR